MGESKYRSFDMPDVSELSEEDRQLAIYAMQMRDKNAEAIGEIERLGSGVDLSSAKSEHILNALVHLGVITETQRWEIEVDWERKLNVQLKAMRARLNEIIHAQREQAKKPPQKKLILPPGMQN
jgi:hypothetical protein